jgi:hypothetical protein
MCVIPNIIRCNCQIEPFDYTLDFVALESDDRRSKLHVKTFSEKSLNHTHHKFRDAQTIFGTARTLSNLPKS